jgi:DNA-binding HxlR family transcriptional regulator
MARHPDCPTELTLELISGRWKVMVIYWLLKGERRFNQLQRDLSGITHRTLAKQLREMGRSGLVERHDYSEIPPRVEYRLTPLGRSLEPILVAMHDWALTHRRKLSSDFNAKHAAHREGVPNS